MTARHANIALHGNVILISVHVHLNAQAAPRLERKRLESLRESQKEKCQNPKSKKHKEDERRAAQVASSGSDVATRGQPP
eukprot:scaffold6852_cov134-Isochrysis_galbana.AAC.6